MPVAWHEPTRDGEKAIPVVGNVPRRKARAPKLAERAGKRWTMATMGQAVTATLTCAVQALGSPKAALLGLCWALMASQAVAVMPAAWRAVHGCAQVQQGIAASSLALESAQTSDGMIVAIPRPHWRLVRSMNVQQRADVLQELAAHVNLRRDKNQPRGPQKKPTPRPAYKNGGHVSTAKILAKQISSAPWKGWA